MKHTHTHTQRIIDKLNNYSRYEGLNKVNFDWPVEWKGLRARPVVALREWGLFRGKYGVMASGNAEF